MAIENIKTLTKNLIQFKTVRSSDGFVNAINNCMDFVCQSLHPSILLDRAENFATDPAYPLTIAKFCDHKAPDLLLVGHIDVVDGDDDQFSPYEKGGKIYGRGAKDMKSGVAAMIEIMNHYAEQETKPNLAIAIVSDEESGGYKGANLIVNNIGYQPKFVMTPDPGEYHGIINKEKGVIWLSIVVVGKSGHASRPWLSDCAYSKAFTICQEIMREVNLANSEEDWRSTAVVTKMNKLIRNGNSKNTYIPDNSNSIAEIVECKFDIRYTENDNLEALQSKIHHIVHKYGADNEARFEMIDLVCHTPKDHDILQKFKSVVDFVEGTDIPFLASSGASDMRFFSEKKIPCVIYGQRGKNHHGKDEYVDIESIETFYKVITTFIDQYLG